jgi:PBP1b-binding outer membrane lipoprotein LpoB
MSKLKSAISLLIILIFFSGCQTVKDKTDAIVEKENEKLSKFLGKSASELQMDLENQMKTLKMLKGNFELIYNSKKYLVPCERRFEINSENIVVGFVSNGCF